MEPTTEVPRRFLIHNCLTRKLFLPMLLTNRSYGLSCTNRWHDVVGVDDIQDSSKASPQLVVLYGCQELSGESFNLSLVESKAHCSK